MRPNKTTLTGLDSSRVARAPGPINYLTWTLFLLLSLHLEPIKSGFMRSKDSQDQTPWQQQQQQQQQQQPQQQQQQYGPPPGNFQQNSLDRAEPRGPVYRQPPDYPVQQAPPGQNYPMQTYQPPRMDPNYTPQADRQNYPAERQSSNHPAERHYGQVPPADFRSQQQTPMPMPMPMPMPIPGSSERIGSSGYQPVPVPDLPAAQQRQQQQPYRKKARPSKSDPCGAINISEMHGYHVREYKIITKDKYELVMHRLIHPSDFKRMIAEHLSPEGIPPSEDELKRMEPKLGDKKPYLLLHGLIGSSASFVRNVNRQYMAPRETYDVHPDMEAILRKRANDNELHWHSTADQLNAAFSGDTSNTLDNLSITQKLSKSFRRRTFARTRLIDFYGDKLNFAYEFTQAYRKFGLPRETLRDDRSFVPNSLAFTLSNFGYDVWLVNLRGNHYSRGYNGPLNPQRAEYWDFNLDRLVKEDLLASINHVKKTLGWTNKPAHDKKSIGIVSYSYSSLHVLALLTNFPQYQRTLQPVIMMAPTLLSSSDKSSKLKFLIKRASQLLISHTGPFPNRSGMKKIISIEGIVCRLPVASKLCNLMTMFLNGRTDSLKNMIIDDNQQSMMLRDSECGQTSTGVLHQIVENISKHAILPNYTPYVGARDRLSRGDQRRSIMIIRSQADEISTEAEIERIKEAAIKGMLLSEVVIEEPKFGHTDFLFSKKNQYLVNAEVARMALVFDHTCESELANRKLEKMHG